MASTRNGVLICDVRQDDIPIIYANPAFERITGYTLDEVLGRNCRFLQGPDTGSSSVRQLAEAIEQRVETSLVLKNYRKDGTAFWNDLYISPVPDEQGEVTHFIGIVNDISEQRRYEHTLAYNASHDVLTNLPNRSLLEDRIRQGMQIAHRYQRTLAVLYIDLDGFKAINDTLGHLSGDQVLIEVGRRIEQVLRPGDTVARLAADEFVVLLPDLAHHDDIVPISEKLLTSIAQPYWIESTSYHLTASIGIAVNQDEDEDPMKLVRQADLAMYQAKQAGRNIYHWYTDDLNREVSHSLRLRSDLQNALDSGDFELHYQPQLSLTTGRVTGLEALIRWRHPELGMVSPGDFIPLAESTGQIAALSDWVLQTACDARRQLLKLDHNLPISLNLSPVLFKDNQLVKHMVRTITENGLRCDQFELEILESVMFGHHDRALTLLNEMRDAGFRLSLDDFGTGFSSLNYLKSLPIHKVKIDRSFVQDLISDQNDAAIVRAIISMAHLLKLSVTAEGVETESQSAFLKREGCDEIQGFLHSRALPLPDLITYLDRTRWQAENDASVTPDNSRCLLILDDDEFILKSLSRALRGEGYQVLLANKADDAFRMLAQVDVQVILSDQRMPEMSGTEFFKRVKSLYPETVRIILSGYTDLQSVTDAINQGAIYKFLTKPWDDDELRQIISDAFDLNASRP
ncbi:EAL domain-containing protein [Saccharospirillum salsuginis]|uniref:EAL domain-containing protein n=1 Tax=Saccharospirillum salsuginis TaxID=418750 RepID=UPI001678F2AC